MAAIASSDWKSRSASAIPAAAGPIGELGCEHPGLVEAAAHGGQHGMPSDDHGPGLHIAVGGGRPRVLGQCHFRVLDAPELHERREPPEQSPPLARGVASRAGQFEHLVGDRQPSVGAARAPDGVQARIERVGQGGAVTGAPSQRVGLVGQLRTTFVRRWGRRSARAPADS